MDPMVLCTLLVTPKLTAAPDSRIGCVTSMFLVGLLVDDGEIGVISPFASYNKLSTIRSNSMPYSVLVCSVLKLFS